MTLSLIGKVTIGIAFMIAFVYVTELFPTDCRSIALGWCSCVGRIGSIVSPYINDLVVGGCVFDTGIPKQFVILTA